MHNRNPQKPKSTPRNRFQGRRVKQLKSNVVIIGVISVAAAFFITRQPGGSAFTLPAAASGKEALILSPEPGAKFKNIRAPSENSTEERSEGGYKLETGPLAVTEVSSIVLHDQKRNEDVHVRIFYPVTSGKYPLIVFSHGAGGSGSCCDALTRHWASYGYITIQPTHNDSAALRRNDGQGDNAFLPAVREALKNPAHWESRARDITFVLDSLPDLENRVGGLSGKIDANRIGVAGHSMGAFTAEAMGGARVDLPARPAANFTDARVKAILCLSPQGPGQFGLTPHSFDNLTLPYMGITGSLDSLGPLASPAWHKIPFERSQPGDKYELFITGARHMSFITDQADSAARSSQAAAILGYTNSASLAFFDAYLKMDAGARQFLTTDALERYSHGAAKLSRR
jgi:predicted dienelactone hydrolase